MYQKGRLCENRLELHSVVFLTCTYICDNSNVLVVAHVGPYRRRPCAMQWRLSFNAALSCHNALFRKEKICSTEAFPPTAEALKRDGRQRIGEEPRFQLSLWRRLTLSQRE